MTSTWLITGASSGMGRILAEKLLDRGDRVFGTARQPKVLADLQEKYPDRFTAWEMDLTVEGAPKAAINAAVEKLGGIDILVSNAAYGLFGAAEEVSDDQIRRQIDVNLWGSIALIRAVLPHMRSRKSGRIVQLSSVGGQIGVPNYSVYCATKFGIEGFVETVAAEVASFGIKCTIFEPGASATSFLANLDIAPAMDAYTGTAAGDFRASIARGDWDQFGNPEKMCEAMIDYIDSGEPALRLVLGTSGVDMVGQMLRSRLTELERNRDRSVSGGE